MVPYVKSINHPSGDLMQIDPSVASRVVMSSADVAVVLNADGVVLDASFAAEARLPSEFGSWLNRSWLETIAIDSKAKAQSLLREASQEGTARMREINHLVAAGGATVPIRYTAMRISEDGRILVVGRDLRAIAALQQQLVQFQQSMEREYARLRAADTRYRVLFQVTDEAALIVDAATRRLIEVNPSASAALGLPASRLIGRPAAAPFVERGGEAFRSALAQAASGGEPPEVEVRAAATGRGFKASLSVFRQEGGSFLLIRLIPADGAPADAAEPRDARVDALLQQLPDGVVVTDRDGVIIAANAAFVDLAGVLNPQVLWSSSLDQWLGHSGVDFGVILSTLKDSRALRSVTTVLRGAYGALEPVSVSGAASGEGPTERFCFVVRAAERAGGGRNGQDALARSPEEIRDLVGRVPLKEIVRETTEIIEKLCILAALELAGDNRASASDMLGLSRQSLYSKMHRFGIGDLSGGDRN